MEYSTLSQTFFILSSLVVVIIAILLVIIGRYCIRILRNIAEVVESVKKESQVIVHDIHIHRKEMYSLAKQRLSDKGLWAPLGTLAALFVQQKITSYIKRRSFHHKKHER